MGKRPHPALIGAFVVGAIVLVLLAVVTFGSGRLFRHTQQFVLYFNGSVNGLEKGAPVKFRGVPIGEVTDILLALPEHPGDPRIPVLIEIDQDRMLELGATQEMVAGPATIDRLMREGGLRAQLKQQSLITGLLYIGFDLFPGSPLALVLPEDAPHKELATLPTPLEQAQAKVEAVLDRLNKVDFEAFGKSLSGVVEGVNRLVNSSEAQTTMTALREALTQVRDAASALQAGVRPLASSADGASKELTVTLQRLQVTLEKFNTLTDPHAPLVHGLTATLADLDDAARAVRELAEHVNRDPSVLLTGKKVQ